MSEERSDITVWVGDRDRVARVRIPASFEPDLLTMETLELLARAAGVLVDADVRTALADIRTTFLVQASDVDEIIATAVEPERGAPATLAWQPAYDPEKPGEIDDTADIDHYAGSCVQIEPDDHVATITPPGPGTEGRDVRGNTLPAKPGPGPSVEFDDDAFRLDDDGRVLATRAGVLQIGRRRCTILDLIQVDECVDFSTGHIDTTGSVRVKGGVKDNFNVNAAGDVTVDGLVEAANISCGGTLRLATGMAARDAGTIRVTGDASVEYLNGVDAAIGGDLYVQRELIGANIRVGGSLIGPKATLIGGETRVSGSLRAKTLGTATETPTRLLVGSLPMVERVHEEIQERMRALEDEQKAFADESEYLKCKTDLSPEEKERSTELTFMILERRTSLAALAQKVEALRMKIESHRRVEITIAGTVYPGVTIVTNDQEIRFTDARSGPFEFGWSGSRRLIVRRSSGRWEDAASFVRTTAA